MRKKWGGEINVCTNGHVQRRAHVDKVVREERLGFLDVLRGYKGVLANTRFDVAILVECSDFSQSGHCLFKLPVRKAGHVLGHKDNARVHELLVASQTNNVVANHLILLIGVLIILQLHAQDL